MVEELQADRAWLQLESGRYAPVRLLVGITPMPMLVTAFIPPVGYQAEHVRVPQSSDDIHTDKTIGAINQMGAVDE